MTTPRQPQDRLAEPLSLIKLAGLAGIATFVCTVGTAGLIALGLVPKEGGRLTVEALSVLAGVLTLFVAFAGLRLGTLARRDGLAAEAINLLPAAYLVATSEGEFAYANAAAHALFPFGESPIAVLRRTAQGEIQRDLMARLEAGALTGRAAHAMLRLRLTENGPLQALDVTVTPLSGRPRRALWRIENVTERERQRELIEADRDRVMDVFNDSPIGLFSIDHAGRFRMINQTMADWLGSSPETLMQDGSRLQDFLLPAQPQVNPGGVTPRPAFDPSEPADSLEILLQGRQGRLLKASISQTVIRHTGSLRTRSVVRDLASERTWEDALRAVRQRFQRFFEIAPVGIALVESEGRFTETNRALEELLTDSREKLSGRDLLEFVGEDARAEVRAQLAAAWAGQQIGGPIEISLQLPRPKNAALFVSRLEDEDGGSSGLILHFIDLTEQKSLEVQFAQSQKMQAVGQLAGGVAHDFNNLLTAMIGFCDLLLLRFRPGDQSFADIMQIKQNANRAANLVRQLLAFSRQQALQPRILHVGDILSELSHLLNRLLGDNIELKVVNGRNLPPVKVDQGQFEQVIINLAVNARNAMANGGQLTIRTSSFESRKPTQRKIDTHPPPGHYVLIEVSDIGTGIPREIVDRIFEPFFSTKEVGSGTGLGLSTVYGIVKQTGGFIFVDSTLGSGSTFSIYLPQQTEPAVDERRQLSAELAERQLSRDLTGVGTVLLVEDEDPVRLFSARALRNKGYNVLEAKSGEAALQIIAETTEPIDLIVTDVVMPRMDGPSLIRQVRENMPDVKVIFISGYTEDTFRKRLDNEQDIHFLAKPFSLKQLAGKVKEIISVPAI